MPTSPLARRLLTILETEGRGRFQAIPSPHLAERLGISERQLRGLVGALIGEGVLVGGSIGRPSGLFLCLTEKDLEHGTESLRRHAISILARVSALKKAAEQQFGSKALHLFDLDQEAS